MGLLNEKTKISVGLLIVLVPVFIWLVRLDSRVEANAKSIVVGDDQQKTFTKIVNRIDRRLSRMEGRLDIKTPLKEDD